MNMDEENGIKRSRIKNDTDPEKEGEKRQKNARKKSKNLKDKKDSIYLATFEKQVRRRTIH